MNFMETTKVNTPQFFVPQGSAGRTRPVLPLHAPKIEQSYPHTGCFENFLAENQHFFQVIYQKMQNDLAIILVQV